MLQYVNLSGGKDSTAMLLLMLERDEQVDKIVFCDTGWEFPQMLAHIDLLEKNIGIEIIRVRPDPSLNYWLFDHVRKNNPDKSAGNGFPMITQRWCTREKVKVLDRINKEAEVVCIGYAIDERRQPVGKKKYKVRYPLVEYGITERDCLKYCKQKGYNWNGIYDVFSRVSCWCCPLQSYSDLRKLYLHFPELWKTLKYWNEKQNWRDFGELCFGRSLEKLEKEFDRQNYSLF